MASRNGPVHVATTKRTYKGKVYTSHLLRRSVREGNTVKHETLGNLSHLPDDLIEIIRRRLAGESIEGQPWEITRSYPHGHVALVLEMARKLGLEKLLASRPCRQRDLVLAMIVARILSPSSKLATLTALREETTNNSLSLELQLGAVGDSELYEAMDWLLARQHRIETKLANKHLQDGTLILYDVSGSYYTGRRSGIIDFGHLRDGKKGVPQIVYGLLCNAEGCPVAIEVFPGNTADPKTLKSQIHKVRHRFGIQRVVLVGDRGMITSRRIDEELRDVEGLQWITALRADNIKQLASAGVIQRSLFDETDLAEVESPDYPGERLVVCRNPLLADERTRKRNELLDATQKDLDVIVAATQRVKNRLKGKDRIGIRVGKVIGKRKMAKHFTLTIEDDRFFYQRNEENIAREAALDGIYVIRASVEKKALSAEGVVRAYKDLAKVERAFRSLKTVDLKIRPIHHWLDDRIRAHVFLCMLAYYVEWHLRQALAPILFDDHDKPTAQAERASIVQPSPRSEAAKQKDLTKQTEDGLPVQSFQSLLGHMATLVKNRVRIRDSGNGNTSRSKPPEFYVVTQPTQCQQRAFDLLHADL